MRAAVLHEAPGELVIEDLEIASPIGREVLIHTKASGLCHSDLHVIEGLIPLPRRHVYESRGRRGLAVAPRG